MNCTIAIAQTDSILGDLRENVDRHLESIEDALKLGAQVVVFPELSLTGYALKDLAADIAVDPASDQRLRGLRRLSRRITIVAGGVVVGDDHGIYNAAITFDGGELLHVHRKVYPPTYGMFEEGRYFSSGRTIRSFATKHGRFATLICEDMWHPSLAYLAVMDGAEALLTLTASPTRVGASRSELDNKVVNHDHQRVYARLLSVYTVFANRVGFEDGVNFWGGSAVFSPSGEIIAEGVLFEKELVTAQLRSTEITRARRLSRHVLDERPEVVMSNLRRIVDASDRKRP